MKANEFKDVEAIGFFKKHGFIKSKSIVGMSSNALIDCGDGSCIHVNRVKRLVESHEVVEQFGGLEKAMDVVINQEANSRPMSQLAQAIADVESCMEVS